MHLFLLWLLKMRGIAQSFGLQAIAVSDCPNLLERGSDWSEVLEQIKAVADPLDSGCYLYMATASCRDLVGVGIAMVKKDRQGLAKLALALAASQDVAKEDHARNLLWIANTEIYNDFVNLCDKWNILCKMSGSHDIRQAIPKTDASAQEPLAPGTEEWVASQAAQSDPVPPPGFDVQALRAPGAAQAVWGPTSYEFIKKLHEVDNAVAYRPGAFLALGEILCMDRYILMQAHVVNRAFQRAPLAMDREFDFPHMTLVKLETGEAERFHDDTIWKNAVNRCEINVSGMLRQLNHDVKSTGLPFRLIPAHVQQCWQGNRYNITGGEGHKVFRMLQALICSRCAQLGQGSLQQWSQAPAHPHITYEYPDTVEDAKCHGWDEWSSMGSGNSRASSLDRVLQCLEAAKLQRYRKIFKRERLGTTALLGMDDARLKEAGVDALGDRIKILNLREALRAERQG